MYVAAILEGGKAGVVERPDLKPSEEFVVVKVLVAPMCTEYKAFQQGRAGVGFGHEAAGEVAATARQGRVKVGDRVAVMPLAGCGRCPLCLSGHYIHCADKPKVPDACGDETGAATMAQQLVKQDWLLLPIPDGISIAHGSMACCGLGPTFGACERMAVHRFDTVLITGMGPVGLGGVINCRHRGARVIAVEGHPYRAGLAKDLGAEAVLDPSDENIAGHVRELTRGAGPDKCIDCTGVPAAQGLLVDAVRRRGK